MTGWLRRGRRLILLCATVWLAASFVQGVAEAAVGPTTRIPQTAVDVLEQMSGRAGVIFFGEVTAVRPAGSASGVVEIDFRVETAIRGCTPGLYTLREWAGLWTGNDRRYRVGQPLLMLLHAPGAAGLSSPVDGLDGAIPIRQSGAATPYTGVATPPRIVDLRWLGAKLPRSVAYRGAGSAAAGRELPPAPFVAIPQTVLPMRSGWAAGAVVVSPASGESVGSSVPAEQASVEAVVRLLEGWEKARYAAP